MTAQINHQLAHLINSCARLLQSIVTSYKINMCATSA